VQGLNVKDESEAIVKTVISLGRTLGMAITAEGVETQAQYDWLEGACQLAQGHFISRPIDSASIVRFLSERRDFRRASVVNTLSALPPTDVLSTAKAYV
jgi:EAL domain-containing protein (putative c-di-GMP-specific phosphodiesterase class I)